ncbi:MAG: isoaspartyl peptidase/L-asparaginase [Erysipelotrichaceae bacterium]|nr:isoaspartyl peptidase/L-asparaginase [Erysipelotrichaceae bacterium]MDD3923819.1 isoaspartyl peptidase/L-asparaginase [Erysipelotrichaceae bacterium]MDD4641896.1 isoaspartyl peptidase/L-asparaginase [Erysipelotrichaceae bacterium]
MKFHLISTWKMSLEGSRKAYETLKNQNDLAEALINGVVNVEDDETVHSVGYGGLPAKDGKVYLDAAYMNGTNMSFGAVSALENIKNPIKVAYHLSKRNLNCYLTGEGASEYAINEGFEQYQMLSTTAYDKWLNRSQELMHDTVCFIGKVDDDMAVAVSTSGLFMKEKGRVGDSPNIGSGYYVDSLIGGCAATGVGENIMRGCLSFKVVMLIKQGIYVQEACKITMNEHIAYLKERNIAYDDISIIALDANGKFGAATSKKAFPFVYADDQLEPRIMVCFNDGKDIWVDQATDEWLATYQGD